MVSAELRWFWPNNPPAALSAWFYDRHTHSSNTAAERRVDRYLRANASLGIKVRGNADIVEVKGLIERTVLLHVSAAPPWHIEQWCKWHTTGIELRTDSLMEVSKCRATRIYSVDKATVVEIATESTDMTRTAAPSADRCTVELTEVLIGSDRLATFAIECSGTLESSPRHLRTLWQAMLEKRMPTTSLEGETVSYPAMLQKYYTAEE